MLICNVVMVTLLWMVNVLVRWPHSVMHAILFLLLRACLRASVCFYYSVWDWELGMQINTLHNHPHSSKARIATLDLINPHDVSLLMVGTGTGNDVINTWPMMMLSMMSLKLHQ